MLAELRIGVWTVWMIGEGELRRFSGLLLSISFTPLSPQSYLEVVDSKMSVPKTDLMPSMILLSRPISACNRLISSISSPVAVLPFFSLRILTIFSRWAICDLVFSLEARWAFRSKARFLSLCLSSSTFRRLGLRGLREGRFEEVEEVRNCRSFIVVSFSSDADC
jgi:hypothetical protein